MGFEVAVLVKQVPRLDTLALGAEGRLRRDGVELEMSAYCRRALTKGVELARSLGGHCTVLTLGPPSAADCLREAVACGAQRGVLVSDPAFAGSDTLATARTLATALMREGPFDLVLAGRNSLDADTGQVPPQVAELLGLPFLAAARTISLHAATLAVECETDGGWRSTEVALPAVVSCAERLCRPAKADRQQRDDVPATCIGHVCAADLGDGPWGAAASPTRVGEVRRYEVARLGRKLDGPIERQVHEALGILASRACSPSQVNRGSVPDGWDRAPVVVAVVAEPGRAAFTRDLLGAAAGLALERHGTVCALVAAGSEDSWRLGCWGADEVVEIRGSVLEEDLGRCVASWAERRAPWALLAPGTTWGREVAGRTAARLGAGLTGDAVEVSVEPGTGRLVGWKPAFGGALVAAITATSPVQMVTIRPGTLPTLDMRAPRQLAVTSIDSAPASSVRLLGETRYDDLGTLVSARCVVGVGIGVHPDEYHQFTPLLEALGAELAATRKVTDRQWMPRSRQVGITGRTITPSLYIAIGLSGKFNHMVGVRTAGTILAINSDPTAPVFDFADIGIVGNWRHAVPLLADQIRIDQLGELLVGL